MNLDVVCMQRWHIVDFVTSGLSHACSYIIDTLNKHKNKEKTSCLSKIVNNLALSYFLREEPKKI